MSMEKIPPEIRDIIIENVYPDITALRACSLTCRAWLPSARRTLFRSISIDPKDTGLAFRRLLSVAPHIAPCVRALEIRVRTVTQRWWDVSDASLQAVSWPTLHGVQRFRDAEAGTPASLLQAVFPPGALPLRSVATLTLSALPVTGAVIALFARHAPDVRVLTIDGCKGLSFMDFIELVSAFPRLHTLRLVAAQWLHLKCAAGDPAFPFPRLRRLEVSRKVDFAPFVTWMVDHAAAEGLTSLACSISSLKHAIALGSLLHALGDCLRHLQIGFADTQHPTDILVNAQFDLSLCTGLCSLRILCAEPQLSSYQPSLSWVVILLSKLHAPLLKEITIVIRSSNLWALNLEGLDVVLSHVRFANLKRVTFDIELDVPSKRHAAEDRKLICRRMSESHAKGILDFGSH
ncbi:hypothetical protein CERSUDRAFT_118095 [Gelatoporia subvermispora B]|uniref:F-box domain-containing protein n=1 Tax=Ceriporiopsis subvermispora (strain B) TaxID=914234 RepID=M2R5U6_CERS8|nr:hypothetical protein CERSUDRAFT_118095 [Gelatoporia subvermispora B]